MQLMNLLFASIAHASKAVFQELSVFIKNKRIVIIGE